MVAGETTELALGLPVLGIDLKHAQPLDHRSVWIPKALLSKLGTFDQVFDPAAEVEFGSDHPLQDSELRESANRAALFPRSCIELRTEPTDLVEEVLTPRSVRDSGRQHSTGGERVVHRLVEDARGLANRIQALLDVATSERGLTLDHVVVGECRPQAMALGE